MGQQETAMNAKNRINDLQECCYQNRQLTSREVFNESFPSGNLGETKMYCVPDDGAKTPLMRSQLARGGKSDIEPGHEFSGVLGFTYNFTDQSTQYQNIRADEVIE